MGASQLLQVCPNCTETRDNHPSCTPMRSPIRTKERVGRRDNESGCILENDNSMPKDHSPALNGGGKPEAAAMASAVPLFSSHFYAVPLIYKCRGIYHTLQRGYVEKQLNTSVNKCGATV